MRHCPGIYVPIWLMWSMERERGELILAPGADMEMWTWVSREVWGSCGRGKSRLVVGEAREREGQYKGRCCCCRQKEKADGQLSVSTKLLEVVSQKEGRFVWAHSLGVSVCGSDMLIWGLC